MGTVGEITRRTCDCCGTVVDSGDTRVELGNLVIDRVMRGVTWQGKRVVATPQMFAILDLLVQRAGKIIQAWSFYATVLNENLEGNQLQVQIHRLRMAFREIDPTFDHIVTHRGEGYRWRRDDQPLMFS